MDVKKHLVWDWPLRVFHWLLVASILVQWLTAELLEDAMDIHMYVGYFTLGLILFRIFWGILGTRYARFKDFTYSPARIIGYLKNLLTGQSVKHTGHNPAGGLMVYSTLLIVGLQAISGLFVTDDYFYSGPYNSIDAPALLEIMSWLHFNLFDALLVVIALHLVALLWYHFKLGQRLIPAMFHGRKLVSEAQAIKHSRSGLAFLIAVAVGVFVYWLVFVNPPADDGFYY